MNPIFIATFLYMGVLVSGNARVVSEDSNWKEEGLPEGQDNGQWDRGYAKWAGPRGADGSNTDTPEAAPLAAKAAVGGWAPLVDAVPAAHNDGSWKGEGLVESQDLGQGNAGTARESSLSYSVATPLGPDVRVVDTPGVDLTKAVHHAARAIVGVHGALHKLLHSALSPN